MDWFYADSGKQIGPIEDPVFRQLATAGIIKNDTLVWRAGMANWQPYQTVEMPVQQPAPLEGAGEGTRFCSECGKPYPPDDLVAFGSSLVCAACKPVFTQKLREGIRPAGAVRYGGFWMRYLAVLVDSTLLSVVIYFIALVVFGIMFAIYGVSWIDPKQPQNEMIGKFLLLEGGFVLLSMVLGAVYETWMVTRYGGTLGKMICRLRIVMADGGNLSYGRSAGRHFAKYISGLTLWIGYIMAGVDEEKRSLHDRICDTRVIKK
ncbi:MAG TPA: RDD family protein [Bryobacteraceae bacterium]|nr:RDD family protein [Bryobacteraceae bacterium]